MARSIPLSTRSLTGRLQSRFGHELEFESRLERDALVLLLFDQWLTDLRTQALAIMHSVEGKRHRYTPDFLATWETSSKSPYGSRQALIEVKYKETLEKDAAALTDRFSAAKRYCDERDMAFVIMSEDEIRVPSLANANRLLPYWNKLPAAGVWKTTRAAVIAYSTMATVETITDALIDAGLSFDAARTAIFHFVARRLLMIDFNQLIDAGTPLALSPNGAETDGEPRN